ncbi:MAG: LuxR C-terminal-related transcriptional regulator [Pseudomonadota bacterium]
MSAHLNDLHDKFKHDVTNDEKWETLKTELSKIGFEYARYGLLTAFHGRISLQDSIELGSFCNEWEENQKGKDWLVHDHVAKHLVFNSDPLTFRELYRRLDYGELNEAESKNHEMSRQIGMLNGVAIPLSSMLPTSAAGISLEGSRGIGTKEFDEHLNENLEDLIAITEMFHASLNRRTLLPNSRIPTEREKECLTWVMAGLRVQEVAYKMGTHPKTVEKQLASARAKLGAKTTAQAVTRAIALDLIIL